MISASMGGQALGSPVLAAVPVWLPVAIVAVFVVAAVTYEILLARRVLNAPEASATEPTPETDDAAGPTVPTTRRSPATLT